MTEEKLIYKITGIVFGLLFIITLGLACDYSYENKNLKEDVSNLQKENKEQKEQMSVYIKEIDYLLENPECNCGFFEDFYYEHSEEVGAYE